MSYVPRFAFFFFAFGLRNSTGFKKNVKYPCPLWISKICILTFPIKLIDIPKALQNNQRVFQKFILISPRLRCATEYYKTNLVKRNTDNYFDTKLTGTASCYVNLHEKNHYNYKTALSYRVVKCTLILSHKFKDSFSFKFPMVIILLLSLLFLQ